MLNSSEFGVPQNRERVFIVGYLRSRGYGGREVFPIEGTNDGTLKQVVGGMQGNRVYDITGIAPTLVGNAGGLGAKTGLYAIPVLTPDRLSKRQNGRRFKNNGEPMFTLTSQDRHGVMIPEFIPKPSDINRTLRKGGWDTPTAKHNFNTIFDGVRIRRLTPRECFRLQGFPDEYFNRARLVNSDSQLYKQAGNGVTVTVVYEIAKRMRRIKSEWEEMD